MTKVLIIEKRGVITGFYITGHANAAKRGEDIVCAAISSVAWSTINGMKTICGENVKVWLGNGMIYMRMPLRAKKPKQTYTLLQSFKQFIVELEREHPQNLRVQFKKTKSHFPMSERRRT